MKSLKDIRTPLDIKNMPLEQLKALANEIRDGIIKAVSEGGGHLASSLGVVELTLALHYVYNTPEDKIVWDVGHQCYAHKMITGRYLKFDTLRKMGGISGFPKRSESPYDSFGTGHSSTSISAATGMIEGRDRKDGENKVIAVIGDGAMTAGLAFEGLNHAGQLKKDLIVILNDNEMSISPNVGALSAYLNRLLTGEAYRRFKRETKNRLERLPKIGARVAAFAERFEESLKGLFLPGMLFEELGFNYFGPIDGHDVQLLINTLGNVRKLDKPALVHIITKKGKGYEYSEKEPSAYHGVGPFAPETGIPQAGKGISFSEALGNALSDLADEDARIVAVTAAMTEGTGLKEFLRRHPKRLYDVGIAEPHAVTFAAGMATEGLRPVVAIYSTFLQRSYDEIMHDVCLQNLPVIFAVDRAGIVGEDGPTHHGVFDISYLRHLPGISVMAPKDEPELRRMLRLALKQEGPAAIRYPRGKALSAQGASEFSFGEAEVIREGKDISIIALGPTAFDAASASEMLQKHGIEAMVINVRFVKPLDENVMRRACLNKLVLTVEDNALQAGFGSSVLEWINEKGLYDIVVKRLGIPDGFVQQGTQAELKSMLGLDAHGIYRAALSLADAGLRGLHGLQREAR